jgi:hypothetical protein
MMKRYRIYINVEKHKDIYECLERIPRPLRGEFIRTAIRFFMDNTNSMNNLRTEPKEKTTELAPQKSFLDVFG